MRYGGGLVSLAGFLVFSGIVTSGPLWAGEKFDVPVPKDFLQTVSRDGNSHAIGHFIPQTETEETWTRKIIVQVFKGMKMDAAEYMAQMQGRKIGGCPQFDARDLVTGNHNGYPSARITLACSYNAENDKGSVAMVRVYSGAENFYYVQQAWRGAPFDLKELPLPDDLLKEWIAFLDAVTVCNPDDAAHPCR
ncbi:MAG: hypothetical protein O3B08_02445 [Proteobacteria bacterium]|nr:hypothetical protein [Pseudomonadota bacterium]